MSAETEKAKATEALADHLSAALLSLDNAYAEAQLAGAKKRYLNQIQYEQGAISGLLDSAIEAKA